MRRVIVVGLLALAAGTASGGYLAELDGGDRITVDSYWEEGDRMHLVRDGIDLNVPRSRVKSLRPASTPPPAPPLRRGTASVTPPRADQPRREELEARQEGIERRLLQAQQQRFEAQARGDSEATLKRLDRRFRHAQERRGEVIEELKALRSPG
jgi:hypothetical protein